MTTPNLIPSIDSCTRELDAVIGALVVRNTLSDEEAGILHLANVANLALRRIKTRIDPSGALRTALNSTALRQEGQRKVLAMGFKTTGHAALAGQTTLGRLVEIKTRPQSGPAEGSAKAKHRALGLDEFDLPAATKPKKKGSK